MTTKEIHQLLIEAANPNTSNQRKNKIQCLLSAETIASKGNSSEDRTKGYGVELVLQALYVGVLDNNPKLLPSLLPVFAIMAGEANGMLVADPDWDYINGINK
jgi:hypothetical protein